MEEVRELKEVLERVEGKLIAAGKIYAAINFAFWLLVMAIYYVVIGLTELPGWANGLYWGSAVVVAIFFIGKVWGRFVKLYRAVEKGGEIGRAWILPIVASWMIGSVIGWGIIPRTSMAVNETARLAVGFLTFIGISLLGQWLVLTGGHWREREMIPSFLLPLLAVPIAWKMENGAIVWAGFVVTVGFTATVLLYLYSAFRAIER
ncbi:hypothetical protein [Pyrococcus yayanosii]|uniref:Uncharacterized protein n=1 Tax=Pyrococcus yayanosii (strain CH1 / JCM 16557) TaxID=529709 RepID=F8AGX9_PYRYC|nr:hypothetical protein [Pyrococcus yayanosii]AEH24037.1 hypothetical protein PYCH_03420 [Pyrococcus yayanosii CH1]